MSHSRPKINSLSPFVKPYRNRQRGIKAENDVRLQIVKTLTDELSRRGC
jgi:hypothetical protein